MSIYCSTFSIDASDHEVGCERLVRMKRGQQAPRAKDGLARFVIVGDKDYAVDDSRQCTCGSGPIVYKHSGVLPADSDPRGGCLSLGAIPGRIDDSTRQAISDDFQPWWPWLRVSIWGAKENDPTVLLTRSHVESLRDALNSWLERAALSSSTAPAKEEK